MDCRTLSILFISNIIDFAGNVGDTILKTSDNSDLYFNKDKSI